MCLINKKIIGNTVIEIYDDCIPKDKKELKRNIKNLYNTINNIANNLSNRGIDTTSMFYSDAELKSKKIEILD